MSAAIVISRLSWSTPEGRSLFSDLDLSFLPERTGLVGRNGAGKTTLLKLMAGELPIQSGGIAFPGQAVLLRQDIGAQPGETVADLFGARDGLDLLRRAGAGEAEADELAEADWTLEARIEAALARAGFVAEPSTPLAALSGGQGMRAALAALIFAEPDFLLLDEPTNNLDRDGRRAVIDLLAGWPGGAIVVSHDRELLDTMDAIVELTSLGATRYSGNWSFYRERKALELAAAAHDLADAERHAEDAARAAQAAVERQARRDSAGRRNGASGSLPRIVAGGLKRQSEASAGANARLSARRGAAAAEAVEAARARIEILQPLSMSLPPTGLAAGKTVLRLDHVTAGYTPGQPVLRDLSLSVTGPERVAVTGPNGAGKTTLLSLVAGRLQPWQGSVEVTAGVAMLDQRVSLLDPALSVAENFRRLNPAADEQSGRAALARFMFRADAALQPAGTLSGGQLLRAGLAAAFGGAEPPSLLILDEPTNHLDIDAIAAIEAALAAYDGALLIVSHDEAFLAAIGITRRVALSRA